ncbi:hypothetical protein ABBQ32_007847 [Trebouxia sp. C0010 RCD-2024]
MFCSISGTAAEEPVVSTKTGYLYEKRLVEKHIKDTGKDPISGADASLEDLVAVKSNHNVKPRGSPATSIPGLLGLLHNEWDAVMLETHTLRQHLQNTRQELSHALYQHDGAVRVIARLKKERDEARAALESAVRAPRQEVPHAAEPAPEMANGKRAAEEGTEGGGKRAKAGITDDIIEVLTATSADLSKGRRKRPMPPGLAAPGSFDHYKMLSSHPLHKTSEGGITAIDLSPASEDIIASAGRDHTVQIYDRSQERKLSELSGHTKRVTDAKFLGHQDLMVSTSADKTTRLWAVDGDAYKCKAVLSEHSAEVVGVALHPTNKYFITASADKSWAFYDLDSMLCMAQLTNDTIESAYSSVALHPDGQILGTGTEQGIVHVWETKSQHNVAKFETKASAPVTSISFSENGYFLATAAGESVKLWDLRKLKNIKTIEPYEKGVQVTSVKFDYSGQYLAVGGQDARVYGVKQDWGLLATMSDLPKKGSNSVLSCTWNKPATKLMVGSVDHNLRVYGLDSE